MSNQDKLGTANSSVIRSQEVSETLGCNTDSVDFTKGTVVLLNSCRWSAVSNLCQAPYGMMFTVYKLKETIYFLYKLSIVLGENCSDLDVVCGGGSRNLLVKIPKGSEPIKFVEMQHPADLTLD